MSTASTKHLIEEVWRASNLSWRQAERIIADAIEIGARQGAIEAYTKAIRLLRK